MVPALVHAHDWDNDYWLERFLRNHNKVADCQLMLQKNARDDFMSNCSPHAMAYAENDIQNEFYEQLAEHPELDEIDFLVEHFPVPPTMDPEEYANIISEIYTHVSLFDGVNSLIMGMYVADAIIRTDKRMEDK